MKLVKPLRKAKKEKTLKTITVDDRVAKYPPPPLSFPTPCRSPGGAGGPSLGQPKIFRYGSLCCCVGDCVVGYCHLYPLYSWQDILLIFAEWNLTAQPCFSLAQM